MRSLFSAATARALPLALLLVFAALMPASAALRSGQPAVAIPPPDPWDDVRSVAGAIPPPDPWDDVRSVAGAIPPPDPWDDVPPLAAAIPPPDPWDD
jgi:hypothetical protein